jgi:hypothetical protein
MYLFFFVIYTIWGSALLFCNCFIDRHYPKKFLDIISSIIFVLFWPLFLLAAWMQEDEPQVYKVQEV